MSDFTAQIGLGEIAEVDDSGKQQTVTHHGNAGQKHSEVYRVQFPGFASHPYKGATGVFLSVDGYPGRSYFIGGEHDEHRRNGLKEGETKFFGHGSAELHFSEGGIVIDAGADKKPIPIKVGDTTITASKDKAIVDVGGLKVIVTKDRIDLGGEGGTAVATQAGFSTKVFAVV